MKNCRIDKKEKGADVPNSFQEGHIATAQQVRAEVKPDLFILRHKSYYRYLSPVIGSARGFS